MQAKDLSDFLVDYQQTGTTISVDCQWLQSQLKELHRTKLELKALVHTNESLRIALDLCRSKPLPTYYLNHLA